jgi:hypothetical protein
VHTPEKDGAEAADSSSAAATGSTHLAKTLSCNNRENKQPEQYQNKQTFEYLGSLGGFLRLLQLLSVGHSLRVKRWSQVRETLLQKHCGEVFAIHVQAANERPSTVLRLNPDFHVVL